MEESNIWATQMCSLLKQYKLPPANTLIQHPPNKQQWKEISKSVNKYWFEKLQKEAYNMSTICLFWTSNSVCRTHYIQFGETCTVSPMQKKLSLKRVTSAKIPIGNSSWHNVRNRTYAHSVRQTQKQ